MLLRLSRGLFWLGLFAALNALFAGTIFAAVLYDKLPSLDALEDYRPRLPMRVYSAEGDLIGEFGTERRAILAYREFPNALVNALLATEDSRFFEHFGVDFVGLARAAVGHATGRPAAGGASTISMQVARNFYLRRDVTALRKIVEIMVALKIERRFVKRDILALYMNQIYLGHGSYGFAAAAREYYGKELGELTLAETAVLAGAPKSPSRANPRSSPTRAKARQRHVLRRMAEVGLLDEEMYLQLSAADLPPLAKTARRRAGRADYVAEEARKRVFARFGEEAYERGFKIYTTVQSRLQDAAARALRDGLLAHESRRPYPGPESYVDTRGFAGDADYAAALADLPTIGDLQPALVVSASRNSVTVVGKNGERYAVGGDSLRRFRQHLPGGKTPSLRRGAVVRLFGDGEEARVVSLPRAEAALAVLSSDDGAILAMVGGFDFAENRFNNAMQARRQVGSAIKPFLFSAALEKGLTPASVLPDAPIFLTAKETGSGEPWQPKNYDGRSSGPITMRRALSRSKNLATIHMTKDIGVAYARDYLLRFGFRGEDFPPFLSMALGAGGATPMEMARGYAAFANGGYLTDPHLIVRVEDHAGNVAARELDFRARRAAIDRRNAFVMISLLRSVIDEGTGGSAKSLRRDDIGGKTGTTNDTRDAWFAGFGGELTAVSWVGHPQSDSLGKKETGARAALPIWRDFMAAALANAPEVEYRQPPGVIAVDVGRDSGEILPPGADEPARREYFYDEYLPTAAPAPKPTIDETEALF